MSAKVKLLRGCYLHDRKPHAPGEVVDVPDELALTLLLANKAEPADNTTRERFARVQNGATWSEPTPEQAGRENWVMGGRRT